VQGDTVYIDLTSQLGNTLPAVANGQVVMPLASFPALATVGGSLSGQPPGLADVLIVARTDAATVVALSAICTHAACDVSFAPGAGDFQCPCHGSIFGLDGAVQKGPAALPLKSYPVTFDGQTITIQVG
jgi:Rieske Fe-S protein